MRRSVVVLLLALALGGAGGAGAQEGLRSPLAAVQALLDARAKAVLAGDEKAFFATVDPEAPAEFRQAQARQFAGLDALPLASYRLEARVEDSGDLSAAAPTRGADEVFLPETRQYLRFEGYDERDGLDHHWLTYVRRGDRWYVAATGDVADLGLDTAPGLWELGPVRLTSTAHFLLISHPEQEARAAAIGGLAEEALTLLRARWPVPWTERLPIILPASTAELQQLLQTTLDLDKFVAFVGYGSRRDDGYATTAPRMYIQDQNLGRYGRAFQLETLVHELVHAASASRAGPFIPAWVHEGVADWVALGRPAAEHKPAGSDGRLPRDDEFSSGSQSSIIVAYREARSAISHLAATAGSGVPAGFFEAAGAPSVAAGSRQHLTDLALQRSAGITLGAFEQGWAGR